MNSMVYNTYMYCTVQYIHLGSWWSLCPLYAEVSLDAGEPWVPLLPFAAQHTRPTRLTAHSLPGQTNRFETLKRAERDSFTRFSRAAKDSNELRICQYTVVLYIYPLHVYSKHIYMLCIY